MNFAHAPPNLAPYMPNRLCCHQVKTKDDDNDENLIFGRPREVKVKEKSVWLVCCYVMMGGQSSKQQYQHTRRREKETDNLPPPLRNTKCGKRHTLPKPTA